MKTKKIFAVLLAGALSATAVVSASAATLTGQNSDGSTEVTAIIEGGSPGEVSYVITIPDAVTFGTLTQPENNENSYKYCNFQVEATEINNFEKSQALSVYLKDGSENNDAYFYLTQQAVQSAAIFQYDVYERLVDDDNIADYTPMNESGDYSDYGYHLCTFTSGAQGAKQDVTLAFNQKNLYGLDLNTIAGDYSGSLVFHSTLLTLGN